MIQWKVFCWLASRHAGHQRVLGYAKVLQQAPFDAVSRLAVENTT